MHVILALVLACVPVQPGDAVFAGPGVELRQTVRGDETTLELVGASGSRWRVKAEGIASATFRADARYVASVWGHGVGPLRVFGPDGQERRFRPFDLATEDERRLMDWSTCGVVWLDSLGFDGDRLVVVLSQRRSASPTGLGSTLEVLVDLVSGTMRRLTPALPVAVEPLIGLARGDPTRRLAALVRLLEKVERVGDAERTALRDFARGELARAAGANEQSLLLDILRGTAADTDREWVAAKALEARWPLERAWPIVERLARSNWKVVEAFGARILEGRLGDAHTRAEVVRTLALRPRGLEYIALGLADPDPYVRQAAEHALRTVAPSDQRFELEGAPPR